MLLKKTKDYFFRGIAVLLPTILTIWIFVQCYGFVQNNISASINRGIVQILIFFTDEYPFPSEEQIRSYVLSQDNSLSIDPVKLDLAVNDERYIKAVRVQLAEKYWVDGPGQIAGFLTAIVAVLFFGAFVASVVGRAIWKKIEHLLLKTPLLRNVYPYIKQTTDFFLTQNKLEFTRVATIEYPRKGLWTLVLVTGAGLSAISKNQDKEFLTVFVPSSPTPFTGYVVTVPKDEVMMLDMSIEDAIRFVMSGGVITPTQQKLYEQKKNEMQN